MAPNFSNDYTEHVDAVVDLFVSVFTNSDGADEGALIGDLVHQFLTQPETRDIHVFLAWDKAILIGACVLSILEFPQDPRKVYLLSPVAVATDCQGQGVGRAMLRHALQTLRAKGADAVVTYGDPAFYGKVGFVPVSAQAVPPPYPLGQPEGWLAQSLTDVPLTPFTGPSHCAHPLDDPVYW